MLSSFSHKLTSISLSKFNLILLILLAFSLSACQSGKRSSKSLMVPPDTILGAVAQNRVHGILKTAFSQVGNPYRYGGASPETGFDCSGFVSWVYKQFGVDLPRSSRDMMAVGTPITRAELRPGDLIFFNYGYSHVGIYTGDDKYIHSPSTGKRIQESNLNGKGRGDHMVGARRIIDNRGVTTISENLKAQWVKESRHQTALALNDRALEKHSGSSAYAPSSVASRTASSKSSGSALPKAQIKSSRSHKVASGDTVVDIAKKYGVKTTDIVAANNLRNKHKLKIGQVLKIPDKKNAKVSSSASKNSKSVKPQAAKSPSVKSKASAPKKG